MRDYDLTYLALGAGVQSSALLVCSALGLHNVPRADVAIFADTGDEPQWVYDYLKVLEEWSPIPIKRCSKGRLSEWVLDRKAAGKRFVNVPLFTAEGGMLRRQCTREFKIEPIQKAVREHLGLKPRQRCKGQVRAMLGISIDEVQRMKPSRIAWITNTYPLVQAELSRHDCLKIVADAGLPPPERSACVFCPYHSNHHWRWIRDNHPNEWVKAVDFDRLAREMTMPGADHQQAFVHRSLVPLDEADLNDHDPDQINMFTNECEGMCGV